SPCLLFAVAVGIIRGASAPQLSCPGTFFLQQLIENLTTAHPLRCRAEASFFSASCSGELTSPSFFRTSGLIRIVEGNITALLVASTREPQGAPGSSFEPGSWGWLSQCFVRPSRPFEFLIRDNRG